MFENPGEKLKNLSGIFFAIGVIAAIVLAFLFGIQEEVYGSYYTRTEMVFKPIPFFGVLIGGILVSYTEGLILYGFGELIENTKKNMAIQAIASPTEVPVATTQEEPIENREELLAAISAALAEELGTDVSAIRILSFKKVN